MLRGLSGAVFAGTLLLFSGAFAAEGRLQGFGKISFGIPREQVTQILGEQINNEASGWINYSTSVDGHPINVDQHIGDGVATRVHIYFGDAQTVEGGAALFSRARDLLVSAYGDPSEGPFTRTNPVKVEAFWFFSEGGEIVLEVSCSSTCRISIDYVPVDLADGLPGL